MVEKKSNRIIPSCRKENFENFLRDWQTETNLATKIEEKKTQTYFNNWENQRPWPFQIYIHRCKTGYSLKKKNC